MNHLGKVLWTISAHLTGSFSSILINRKFCCWLFSGIFLAKNNRKFLARMISSELSRYQRFRKPVKHRNYWLKMHFQRKTDILFHLNAGFNAWMVFGWGQIVSHGLKRIFWNRKALPVAFTWILIRRNAFSRYPVSDKQIGHWPFILMSSHLQKKRKYLFFVRKYWALHKNYPLSRYIEFILFLSVSQYKCVT